MKPTGVFKHVLQLVSLIPSGKVSTYGNVAKALGINPQVVGWALRGNEDQNIPCHRVVKNGGILAPSFSLGNWPEQRRRLETEGIKFKDTHILNFDQTFIDLTNFKTS